MNYSKCDCGNILIDHGEQMTGTCWDCRVAIEDHLEGQYLSDLYDAAAYRMEER